MTVLLESMAQLEWEHLQNAPKLDGMITEFHHDTADNILYAVGHFTQFNGVLSNGVMMYDGAVWTALDSIPVAWRNYAVTSYKGHLYAGGEYHNGIMRWDGQSWHMLDSVDIDGAVYGMAVIDNELWVAGTFSAIGNVEARGLARWDGGQWKSAYDFPITTGDTNHTNIVTTICEYKGEVYVGGNLQGGATQLSEIARYDGIQWTDVGGGIKEHGLAGVNKLIVYRDELYVLGRFIEEVGNADNSVMRWNGSEWLRCGGGVMSGAWDGVVYDDMLWVTGQLRTAGGVPVNGLAIWDGEQWCSPGNEFNSWPTAMVEYHDTLFLGGGFQTIDGDSFSFMAAYTGQGSFDSCGTLPPLGVQLIPEKANSLAVFPNPASSFIEIEQDENSKIQELSIYSMDGQLVMRKTRPRSEGSLRIDVSGLPLGLYLLKILTNSGAESRTFVKQ